MFKKLFVPSQDSDLTNMALLVARLWLGLLMVFNHGLDKVGHFQDLLGTFPDPLGVGREASLILVILAEVGAALLLTAGLMTRIAAAVLVIDLFVAFLMVHKVALTGQGSGELAFVYVAGYVFLLIAGGGLFSLDTLFFGKSQRSKLQQSS